MALTQTDLIAHIAMATKLTKKDITMVLSTEQHVIKAYLKKGGEVNLMGFGKFGVRKQNARLGRNPRTGAQLKIKAKKVPFFKAGAALKRAVN